MTETNRVLPSEYSKTPAFYRVNGISAMDQKGCGVLISHPVLNSAYLAGESSWYDGMKQVLKTWKPRLIVVSAGFSGRGEGRDTSGQFGMSREEIAAVHLSYPRAHIITTGCPDNTCSMVSRRELENMWSSSGWSSLSGFQRTEKSIGCRKQMRCGERWSQKVSGKSILKLEKNCTSVKIPALGLESISFLNYGHKSGWRMSALQQRNPRESVATASRGFLYVIWLF
ncbi:MAG: hypothetical protein ACLR6B_06685 [Blautia sp.]